MKRFIAKVMATILTISSVLVAPVNLFAGNTVSITSSAAWAEMAYVTWADYSGATDYNVYYKSADKDYVKIDDELVRGTRADILGLPGNITYTVKVVPVVGGSEVGDAAATVDVTPHKADRSGFAFTDEHYTTGGYNKDGSVPENATIIYVTPENQSSLTIPGVEGVSGFNKVLEYLRKNDIGPVIMRFIGNFTTLTGISAKMYKVKQLKNVTFEGVGESGFTGIGFEITGTEDTWNTQNIEIKNFYFKDYGDDGISLVFGATGVWIHHNYFGAGHDGACDVKRSSSFVTISENICEGANKAMLCGHDDERGLNEDIGKLKCTYHHNYYKDTTQRNPRVRFGEVHVYNNYYTNTKSYCVASACDAQVLVEGNYYQNAKRPYIVSQQGNALDDDGKNLLTQSWGGLLKAQNNILENCTYNNDATDTKTDGFTFDPSTYYSYTAQSPQDAKERNLNYCGNITYAKTNGSIVDETTQTTTQTTTETTTEKPTETTTDKPITDGVKGDVNKDGSLTASDAANVLAHVLNSDSFSLDTNVADADSNGQITASDAATILAKVLNSDFNM